MLKDFSGQKLRGKSFKGHDLTGANFSRADIRGVNFQDALLVEANFSQAKAGLGYSKAVLQGIVWFILAVLLGIFSMAEGVWIAFVLEEMKEKRGIAAFQFNIIVLMTVGLVVLLLGILVVLIHRGRLKTAIGVCGGVLAGGFAVATVWTLVGSEVEARVIARLAMLMAAAMPLTVGILATIGATVRALAGTLARTVTWVAAGILPGASIVMVLVIGLESPFELWTGTQVMVSFLALILLVVASYIDRRMFHEDEQFAFLQKVAVALASLGGTNFRGAHLTNADFTEAILKNSGFSHATITHTCWQGAQHLNVARLTGTILADRTVRELLVTGDGSGQSFAGKDLRGAYLVGANLSNADLCEADVSGATLQGADLREANLTKTTALEVTFKGADLTGACVEAWNIDSTTQLEGACCEYIYLLADQQERRPNSGTFGEGEFSKLFQEVLHTVDFIFKNGIDWQAFLVTFDSIREKIRVESDGADIAVQSIENKGDGVFVVKVVAQEVDKESLHREFTEQYKQQLAIQEAKYHALLQGKEEVIALQRQQAIDMKEILHTLMQKQAINITGEVVLGDKRTIQTGRDYLEQVAGDVTTGESTSESKQPGESEDAGSA